MKLFCLIFLSFIGVQSYAFETVLMHRGETKVDFFEFRPDGHADTYIIRDGVRCCSRDLRHCPQLQQPPRVLVHHFHPYQASPQTELIQSPSHQEEGLTYFMDNLKTIGSGQNVFYNNKLYSCKE